MPCFDCTLSYLNTYTCIYCGYVCYPLECGENLLLRQQKLTDIGNQTPRIIPRYVSWSWTCCLLDHCTVSMWWIRSRTSPHIELVHSILVMGEAEYSYKPGTKKDATSQCIMLNSITVPETSISFISSSPPSTYSHKATTPPGQVHNPTRTQSQAPNCPNHIPAPYTYSVQTAGTQTQ